MTKTQTDPAYVIMTADYGMVQGRGPTLQAAVREMLLSRAASEQDAHLFVAGDSATHRACSTSDIALAIRAVLADDVEQIAETRRDRHAAVVADREQREARGDYDTD